jgi:Glycosyltransferase family 87
MVARSGIASVVASIVAVGVAMLAVRIVQQGRGAVQWRLAAYCAFLAAPALWFSVGDYGHVEQPLELLFVFGAALSAMRGRWAFTGVALGLAALTRSTALLYLIPFVVLLLASRKWRLAARLGASTSATVAIGLVPFAIADAPALIHSLVTYRGSLPIGGGSFWVVAWRTTWSGIAQHGDVSFVLGVATAVTVVLLRWRPHIADRPAGIFGLLTIVAACFPMLTKTAFPYYLLEPYAFAAVWWLARPGNALNWRIAVPLLLTADAFILKQASGLPFDGLGLGEGVASSAVLAVVIVLVALDLLRPRPTPEGTSAAAPPVPLQIAETEPALAG